MTDKKARGGSRAPRALAEKLAAVKDFEEGRRYGVTPKQVAAKYSVSEATLYFWSKQKREGKLAEPKSPPGKAVGTKNGPAGAPPRRHHTDAFKAKVVEDYIQRAPGTSVAKVAAQHGVTRNLLTGWIAKSRAGTLPAAPEPDRSELARAPRSNGNGNGNGHAAIHAQLSLTMGENPSPGPLSQLPPALQFYVQRLESQNKALRKMLQIAMEAI